jgi:hypothetical protein
VYATEYATLESSYDMGFYDVNFDGTEGVLLFFPTKSIINDFDICTLSYNINDNVYWYKAQDSNYKMCSQNLWEMQALQDQRDLMGISNEDEEDGEDFDPGVFTKKKEL